MSIGELLANLALTFGVDRSFGFFVSDDDRVRRWVPPAYTEDYVVEAAASLRVWFVRCSVQARFDHGLGACRDV